MLISKMALIVKMILSKLNVKFQVFHTNFSLNGFKPKITKASMGFDMILGVRIKSMNTLQ